MNRLQATTQIVKSTSIKKVNLSNLNAKQVRNLAETGEVTLTLAQLESIFSERNERASLNSKMSRELSRLRYEGRRLRNSVKVNLVDMSKEELSAHGLMTKEDAVKAIKLVKQEVINNKQKAVNLLNAYNPKLSLKIKKA